MLAKKPKSCYKWEPLAHPFVFPRENQVDGLLGNNIKFIFKGTASLAFYPPPPTHIFFLSIKGAGHFFETLSVGSVPGADHS